MPPQPHTFSPKLLATGGLVAMASAVGIGRFIYTPILPHMVDSLHLSKSEAGLIASANFIGYLAGAIAAASPAVASRPRAWLIGWLAVSGLTTALMAAPSSLVAFLVLRFLGGAASAYVLVLASALVLERLAATGNARFSALHFSGVGIGITLSAVLTWVLVDYGLGWRAMWLVGGLMALAGWVAVTALVSDGHSVTRTSVDGNASERNISSLRLLAIAYSLFGIGYIITATFLVVIVRGSPSAAPFEPVFWLVLGLSAIPSVTLWVALGRKWGTARAFAAACVAEAIGVFASVAGTSITALVIASALLGGTFMGLTALGLIAARDLAPDAPRRWVGRVTVAFSLGQIVGPLVAGYGFDMTGSFFMPSMLAVVALLVAAVLAMRIHSQRIATA